jgi:NAD(P)H dehydrogenase (quinone)
MRNELRPLDGPRENPSAAMKFLKPRLVQLLTGVDEQEASGFIGPAIAGTVGSMVNRNRPLVVVTTVRAREGSYSAASVARRPFAWSTALRVLILYANPVTTSFGAVLHREVVTTLLSGGHEIDNCDLYAERFDPVLSEQERMQYHDTNVNRRSISAYADRLLAVEALVLIYPVWNEGFPAILKGFFDRVFIPGVSFSVGPDGAIVPDLRKLRKLAAVCTYGATRTISFVLGDPPKRVVKRLVRSMPSHSVSCDYLAYYDMDHSTPEQRTAFLLKVKRTFGNW